MKQKGFAPILILVIVVIIGAVGFFAVKSSSKPITSPPPTSLPTTQPVVTPKPTPSPKPEPISNWKVYSNSEFNFTFKYPPNLTTNSKAGISGSLSIKPFFIQDFVDEATLVNDSDAGFDGFSVWVTDIGQSTLEQFIDAEITSMEAGGLFGNGQRPKIKINIGGLDGYYVDGTWSIRDYYLMSTDGKTVIGFSRLYRNDSFVKIFDQVLSTFKIIQ